MNELERVAKLISEKLGVEFSYYAENIRPKTGAVCDRQFEGVIDDGSYTFFRFLFKSVGYIGVLMGAGEAERNYATLLPAYIESFTEKETELSKTEHLKRILKGESSSMGIYKYATKYSVRGAACFTIVLRIPKLMEETLALLEQYGGNSLDTVVQMNAQTCVLVRFIDGEEEDTYRGSVDYAEFLVQSIKEELGLDVSVGVGPTVRELKDVALSYAQAENTLRYADVFNFPGRVHSYRECILIKMIEDIPESKLVEYFLQITDDRFKEVFEDDDMLETAEAFLQSS
ncbi:MAG: hypothetical protein IJD33_03690, partial [Clostridia bacterium]|nr:hypothetical protein [Clostridia bacterium]